MLPVAALLAVALTAAVLAWFGAGALISFHAGRQAVEEMHEHTPVRRFVEGRLDAELLTGLVLTVALLILIAGGTAVALLALLVRRSEALSDIDAAAARWAHVHASHLGHTILSGISLLASTPGVILVAVLVGAIEMVRVPSRSIPIFLVVVTIGDSVVTNTVKGIIDRARPAIDPAAASLGPSFPSGHSSTAAAFYAALALLAWRRRKPGARRLLAALAVGVAVAVACSRVMLDLHWLSDVIAGLALGWAWFAVCAIAFGGPLLRFGRPIEEVAARPTAGNADQRGVGSARS